LVFGQRSDHDRQLGCSEGRVTFGPSRSVEASANCSS
jgi:hypothetical protein